MVIVQSEPFDVGKFYRDMTGKNPAIGAVCAFVGLVRDFQYKADDEKRVNSMTLEHYPGMTEKKLSEIEQIANERWPLEDSLIIHRYGRLEPGDEIVLVLTASPHRQAAFESAQFLMDYLKTEAPFWKLEEDQHGDGNWVDARDSDDQALEKWKT